MGDLLSEHRMTLAELARQENVAIPTTWRWATRGVRGCRLETFNVGGKRYTTRESFHRFVAATTAAAQGGLAIPSSRTNRARDAAASKAEAALSRSGVK